MDQNYLFDYLTVYTVINTHGHLFCNWLTEDFKGVHLFFDIKIENTSDKMMIF